MDLKNAKWMYLKAAMFFLIGACCFVLVLSDHPAISTAVYLVLMVWAFARAYYFAFYVIEKYVDGQYRFSGLISFFRYVVAGKVKPNAERSVAPPHRDPPAGTEGEC